MNRPEEFWARVDRGRDCWTWRGYVMPQGYGQATWRGRQWRSHRLAYELVRGPIPDGLTLDHLCRNKACVNPAHLEPVTDRENVLRGIGISAVNSRKTHCLRGHVFDDKNTRRTPKGRDCRACHRQRQLDYMERRRNAA